MGAAPTSSGSYKNLLFFFFLFELHRHDKKAWNGMSMMAVAAFSSPR
jgi:hypothetical protein